MKKALIIIVVLVLGGLLYASYLFVKKPVDTRTESPDHIVSSIDLVNEFLSDEKKSSEKYVDKILLVSGAINDIDRKSKTIFLQSNDPLTSVTCSLYESDSLQFQKTEIGDILKVKGKCTGKLMDVIISNGSIISINKK